MAWNQKAFKAITGAVPEIILSTTPGICRSRTLENAAVRRSIAKDGTLGSQGKAQEL